MPVEARKGPSEGLRVSTGIVGTPKPLYEFLASVLGSERFRSQEHYENGQKISCGTPFWAILGGCEHPKTPISDDIKVRPPIFLVGLCSV